jgi:hypothetical protein
MSQIELSALESGSRLIARYVSMEVCVLNQIFQLKSYRYRVITLVFQFLKILYQEKEL